MISGKGIPMNVIHNEPCNVQPMLSLFDKAKQHLKKPSLKYEVNRAAGEKIVFYLAGPTSRYAGMIMISNGKMYTDPENKWFGYISNNVHDAIYFTQQANEWNKQVIKNFVENPLNNAVVNGKEFCNCCFCGIELTSKESLHAGYGPICAENWGLPWGDTGELDFTNEELGLELELNGLKELKEPNGLKKQLPQRVLEKIQKISTEHQRDDLNDAYYKGQLTRIINDMTEVETGEFSQFFREEKNND